MMDGGAGLNPEAVTGPLAGVRVVDLTLIRPKDPW